MNYSILTKGFHFLDRIQFTVARTTANSSNNEQPQCSVEVSLHPRSIRRSIEKLRLKQEELRLLESQRYSSADHPAYVQRHWYRWANWWQRQHEILVVREPKWSDGETCGRMYGSHSRARCG